MWRRHSQVFLVKNESELRELFYGSDGVRAASGDKIVLLRSIELTSDLKIPCTVVFLMPPEVEILTKDYNIEVDENIEGGQAVTFQCIPDAPLKVLDR